MSKNPKKLKRVVITQELVELTGHHIQALLLNQFIYWSKKRDDFDEFIEEEKNRMEDTPNIEKTSGWIFKSRKELLNELMLNISNNHLGTHLNALIENEWLNVRRNPKHKWDKTYQYRPDIIKIQNDLHELGYSLPDYPLQLSNRISCDANRISQHENRSSCDAKQYQRLHTETTAEVNNHKNDYSTTKTLESFRERKVNRKKRKLSFKKSSMKEKTKQRANDKAPAKKNNKPKFENKPNLDLIEVWNKQPHLRSHKNNQSKVYGEALKRLEHLRQGTLYKIVSQSELANGVFANGLPTEWPKTKWKKKYIAKAIKTLNEWCKEGNYPENKKWISSISLGDAIYNPRTGTSILMSAFKNGVQPLFNPRNYLHDERQAKIYERFEEYFGATKASTKKKIVELAKDLSDTREEYHRAWAQVNPQDYGFGDTDAKGNKISPASSLIMVGHYIKFLKGDEELNVNDFKPRANISPLSLKIDGFPWKKFVEAYQQVFNAHPIEGPL